MAAGFIYLLTNTERPEICKIGLTTNTPEQRCRQINQSEYLSVTTWRVAHYRMTADCEAAEKAIHKSLDFHRLPLRKHVEAFEVTPEIAIPVIDKVCSQQQHSAITMSKKDFIELFGPKEADPLELNWWEKIATAIIIPCLLFVFIASLLD